MCGKQLNLWGLRNTRNKETYECESPELVVSAVENKSRPRGTVASRELVVDIGKHLLRVLRLKNVTAGKCVVGSAEVAVEAVVVVGNCSAERTVDQE